MTLWISELGLMEMGVPYGQLFSFLGIFRGWRIPFRDCLPPVVWRLMPTFRGICAFQALIRFQIVHCALCIVNCTLSIPN